jgi:hypothetical protein
MACALRVLVCGQHRSRGLCPGGRERITEKRMRGIARVVDWEEQEKLFAPLVAGEVGA